jgi:methylated-DNA-[protein]-cysteine S-methyltransferase
LAQKIGKPNASRAVGQALGRNPLPIIIPCHRIIESDGTLGGYSGGTDIKRRLLDMEYYVKLSEKSA